MKKHILSRCAECNVEKNFYSETPGKTTYETSTIEVSDLDEFLVMGSTLETRSTENGDPDEFLLGPTNFTKSIETSDADEFLLGPTKVTETIEISDPDEFVVAGPTKKTFSLEDSDPDEFVVGNIYNQMDGDFDELLLI